MNTAMRAWCLAWGLTTGCDAPSTREPPLAQAAAGGAAGAATSPGATAGSSAAGAGAAGSSLVAGATRPAAGSGGTPASSAGTSAPAGAGTGASGGAGASGAVAAGGGGTSGGAAGTAAPQAGAPAAGSGGGSGRAAAPRTTTFRNPLNRAEGSDPWLVHHDGNYYLTATTWSSRLTIARAKTLDALRSAEPMTVWEGDQPSRCCNMWAPELHLLDGPSGRRWYLYYTAGPSGMNTDNQRMHVLESEGADPIGPYRYKARIFDPATDTWAIDASVFRLNDQLYYVYSAWEGENQNLFIVAMENPWTMRGGRRRLSTPTHAWERVLANVNEGAVALQRGDDTFLVYSASACWGPEYKLGMLRYLGGDPLAAASWRKSAQPVFVRANDNEAFGPGHNGFFKSPDGTEDWIVYHANDSESGVCDTKRTTRAQKFDWNPDGTPNFGKPVAAGVELPGPSGE